MFGISSLGWIHTLGSLPAIPAALYMLARHGRIVPRSRVGTLYFVSMLIGGTTTFLVAHQPVSYAFGVVTLVFLLAGYAVGLVPKLGRARPYLETIFLSLTVFLLLTPAVSETLRRVPDGHPLVTSMDAPLLVGAQLSLFVALIVGVAAQVIYLWRSGAGAQAITTTGKGVITVMEAGRFG